MNAPRYISRNAEENPNHNYALPAEMTNDVLLLQRYNINGDPIIRQIQSLDGLDDDGVLDGTQSDSDESDEGGRASDLISHREAELTLEDLIDRAALLGPADVFRARSWSVPTVQVLVDCRPETQSWRWWFR